MDFFIPLLPSVCLVLSPGLANACLSFVFADQPKVFFIFECVVSQLLSSFFKSKTIPWWPLGVYCLLTLQGISWVSEWLMTVWSVTESPSANYFQKTTLSYIPHVEVTDDGFWSPCCCILFTMCLTSALRHTYGLLGGFIHYCEGFYLVRLLK